MLLSIIIVLFFITGYFASVQSILDASDNSMSVAKEHFNEEALCSRYGSAVSAAQCFLLKSLM